MAQKPTPANLKRKGVLDASVLGTTGLRHTGGYVNEEFLPELVGQKGVRAYREMADNDATVGAVLFAISMLIRQSEWTVQAVDDTPEAQDAKTFVEEVMSDMAVSWSAVMSEICSMFVYGFAPMELVWKRRDGVASDFSDGRIGLKTISLRSQTTLNRWDLDDETGEVLGMYQQPWNRAEIYIPAEKMLLFRTTADRGNPEGRSILRTAYRSYFFKKKIEGIEAVGIERDMAGLPVAYIPSQYFEKDADAPDKAVLAEWQKLVTTIRRDQREGVVLPSDRDSSGNLLFELQLLSSAGSRTFDTTAVVERYNKSIATSVLADFIFLGQQAVGSFALSSDKTALFATAIGAFAQVIADTLNRDLMPKLWRYNGFDREFMPTLVCGDLERQNLEEIAAFITALTGAGAQMFPDRELENHLRGLGGLPLAPEDGEEDFRDDMLEDDAEPGDAEPGAEQNTGQRPTGGRSPNSAQTSEPRKE